MKKFVKFYYWCSCNLCLWTFLSIIGFMFPSSSAFAQQSGDFTYTVSGGTVTITGYTCPGGPAVIPPTINNMPVVGIGDLAFSTCTGLTNVTIPDSVTSIGNNAFDNCTGLTSVTIPNSVTNISSYAFEYCSGLTSVTIPSSVTSIGEGAFDNCTGLTSVNSSPGSGIANIPDSVTSIGVRSYGNCIGLTSIVVDANNTAYSSQDGVLYDKAMTVLIEYPGGKSGGLTIPNSVTSIGVYAFSQCSGLTSVTIPSSVTSIGNFAFQYCSGLTSVTIPSSVTSIGGTAFVFCSGLTSIVVDANNTAYSSQDGVLYDKAMTVLIEYPGGKSGGLTIPSSVTSIVNRAFYGCSGLTSVTIPSGVTSIGENMFYGCSGLTSVTIGNSVTSIGFWAFAYCTGLTSVTIPSSVTSIEDGAFNECSGLTRAYFLGNAPSMGQDIFKNCSSNFTVCYTAGSTGFTNPWYGYPATVCEETLTTSTSVALQTTTTSAKSSITSTSSLSATTSISSTTTSVAKLCPIEIVAAGEAEKLGVFRRFRDEVLLKTEDGRSRVVQFYQHSFEITMLLIKQPELAIKAHQVFESVEPEIERVLAGGKVVLSPQLVAEIDKLISGLAVDASPALREALLKAQQDIQQGDIFKALGIKQKRDIKISTFLGTVSTAP